MKRFAKKAEELCDQIAEAARELDLIATAQEHAYEPELEGVPLLREMDRLLRAHSAVENLRAPLTRLYLQRSQNAGDIWRISFASSLFRTWWQLTARDPSTTKPFTSFLDAAWQSLSADELPFVKSWESAIETARARARNENPGEAPWRIDEKSSL
ncbi:hypothetical protein [Bradyrhizobium vignae]|uniref:hypothetical protein n=1 Tax=Bradyrhizobium vignae TaxID=1549949 RepID=UPI00100AE8A4|nr:hypothetical protein [Bradyrhizobium vignae]RXG92274.1 hypothetical protein EAV90_27200 [Bradyrhizobium vignae]